MMENETDELPEHQVFKKLYYSTDKTFNANERVKFEHVKVGRFPVRVTVNRTGNRESHEQNCATVV